MGFATLFLLFCTLLAVPAKGQHLADVLVSLQDRQRAVEQRIQLYVHNTQDGVVADQQLIEWEGLESYDYPSATNVDALEMGPRIALLNQAVAEFGRLSGYYLNVRADDVETGGIGILRPYLPGDFEDLGRVGVGNYNQVLTALAMRIRRLRVLTWTATLKTATESFQVNKTGRQSKDSPQDPWGAWDETYDDSLVPGNSAEWMPASIGTGGKHIDDQDSTYRIHWNWFNFRWEESVHVRGEYTYQETATSRTKHLELDRTRTFPREAALYSEVPDRTEDQLPGKVALLRRVRWCPAPFASFTAAASWNPVNGDWQLVASEENATEPTSLEPKEEVSVALTWGGNDNLKNASPTGLQQSWAGSNHLSRIYAAVCVPEFTNGVDAPGVASLLVQSGRVGGGPGGDGKPLVHPLPELMAGIPLGSGLEGFGSGWIGISPTDISFADQRYVGEGGIIEWDSWKFAARFMRFDYISNLRFTGSAEDFHVVYAAGRDLQSRGAGLPSAKPTLTEQRQSGWNAFSVEQNGVDGRDFFLAWDLPRIRQIVGRDLIADVEMQGHYKCTVKIYRRPADADPVDRTPGALAPVDPANSIRTVVIESPGVGDQAYPVALEKTRFTDGTHIIEVWREGSYTYGSAQKLDFKEMNGGNELYLKSIDFTTSTVTEKLGGEPWKTSDRPGVTLYPQVMYYPDGWFQGPRMDAFHDYPGKEGSVWWNPNPPSSETITVAGEDIEIDRTLASNSAGTRFRKFPAAITVTRPDRPNETFGWDGSGILTSHENGLWKYAASVSGTILTGTTRFDNSVIGRDWTQFLDSGRRVKSYSAPDGGVTDKDGSAVDWSEIEYGDAGTGLPGLPHKVTRKDGAGTTWAWTLNEDGSATLEVLDGLLASGMVTKGTKSTSTTNERGYVTATATYLVDGETSLHTGGSSTPEGEFSIWGAPLKSLDFATGSLSSRSFDHNFSRPASITSPLGLVTGFSDFDALDRPQTVAFQGIVAHHTFTGLTTDTEFTGSDITGTTESTTTHDGLARLITSNTTWNGVVDKLTISPGSSSTGIKRENPLGTYLSTVRNDDGSLSSASGPTLPFGGPADTGRASVDGGLLKTLTKLTGQSASFQTTWTDAWGHVRKTETPSATGSGTVETQFLCSDPDSPIKRVLTIEPSGRRLITESDPYNASGAISRTGIDVNGNGSLGATDRYVQSATNSVGGKLVTTLQLSENNGLREILRTETDPANGETVTTIDGNEETITRTPDYGAKTIHTHSSKGWDKHESFDSLGLTTTSNLSGTGISTATLDPTWRADGTLESVSLTLSGETHKAGFKTDGTLDSLKVPADPVLFPNGREILGEHTYANGVETLTVDGVTRTRKLDGTKHTTSGGDILGKTEEMTASGTGFNLATTPVTGAATNIALNSAGAPTAKNYAVGPGESYGYQNELLHTVTLARGGSLEYGYSDDGAKDITSAEWPAVTSGNPVEFDIPAIAESYGHDRAGRIDEIGDASGARIIGYQNGRLKQTAWFTGPLADYKVIRVLDASGRETGFELWRGNVLIHSASKEFTGINNESDEPASVTSGNLKVIIGRNAARQLTGFEWGNATGTFNATVTQTWERGVGGRIEAAGSDVTGAPAFDYLIDGHPDDYSFDGKGRRLKCATAGGEWDYQYTTVQDTGTAGQLKSAIHPTLGSFNYHFDAIGRRSPKTDPPTNDPNFNDVLNRTMVWENSQTKTISIVAHPEALVTFNGNVISGFTGSYTYAIPSPGAGGGWFAWDTLAVLEGQGEGAGNPPANPLASPDAKAEQSGAVWVPPVSENFTYDAAGNRESSALWNYGWDAKNQLVRARTKNYDTAVQGYDNTNDYDAENRRFRKIVKRYQSGQIAEQKVITFLHDGNDLIYERQQLPSGLTILERKYVWGPDISGTHGGAGDAGGLLLIRETKGDITTDLYPLYDGSGSVIALTDNTGVLQAEYAYGPFGELIYARGPRASSCPFRFATKYYDQETGLYNFGKRFLEPITGQWLSREPLGESESVNLYSYCHNDPINKIDVNGLAEVVTSTPGGNDVLVNDETSFWLVYNMMAEAGLVGKLDPFGGKPTFTDAMVVAGKLGGTVKNYPKAWPWAATGTASPNDLWIMPGSASLPGNPGDNFDSGIIGMQANRLASGKGFYLDAVDARGIQAAGEATSSFPWGTLSDREAQILGDRGGVLTWWDTPLLTVGGGNGRDEFQWGGGWSQWQPGPGPRGRGYAMGTTPWGTPRMVGNMLAVEVASAGLAKGFGAFRAFANAPLSVAEPQILTAPARVFERTHGLAGNASTRNVQGLMESMRANGWQGDPISVLEYNGSRYILDGHHRVQAAMRAGVEVPYNSIPASRLGEYGYSSIDEVIRAFSEAGPIKIRVR